MTGPEVASAARAMQPVLPVVYMSGYPEGATVNRAPIGPHDILLNKPFSYTKLGETLRDVLRVPAAGSG